MEIANEANLTAEELELQHKRKEFIYIQKSSVQLAMEKGMAQGLEQGLEQVVIKGHQSGMAVSMLCNLTGLTEKKVLSIINALPPK